MTDEQIKFATINDFLSWASEYFEANELFYGHGTDNAWDEAVMLILSVFQFPPDVDDSILEQKITSDISDKLLSLAKRRVEEHIPIPYLTNEAWFLGERYYVDENVIIPRSPLAELIINHLQPWIGEHEPKQILDLCTGSGCIAIACAKEFADAKVDAVDISSAAIKIANKNIKLHQCDNRVKAIESDLFTSLGNKKYDVIISNPPYVDQADMDSLPLEYKHEPVLALASGSDGLDLTTKILQNSAQHLTEHGVLIVEVGNSWEALDKKYPNVPFTWLEFSQGGEGVFVLSKADLEQLQS